MDNLVQKLKEHIREEKHNEEVRQASQKSLTKQWLDLPNTKTYVDLRVEQNERELAKELVRNMKPEYDNNFKHDNGEASFCIDNSISLFDFLDRIVSWYPWQIVSSHQSCEVIRSEMEKKYSVNDSNINFTCNRRWLEDTFYVYANISNKDFKNLKSQVQYI